MTASTQRSAPSTSPGSLRLPAAAFRAGRLPRWVIVPASLGVLVVLLPLVALATRVDWSRIGDLLGRPSSLAALTLSVQTSLTALLCCVVVGVPLALLLARADFPGRSLIRALVSLPLVLPPVVGGLALLTAFGRRGLLGSSLQFFGVQIAFTTAAVVLAQTFVALPFLVLSLEGTLRTEGRRFGDVAATLGAAPSTVLWRVTLPQVAPGLASAAVLCFARALGEFGATITFAGSLQGVTRTLPLEIYLQRVTDPDAAVALSMVLVALAVLISLVSTRLSGWTPR